jgi:hypothetical protein
LDGGSFCTTWMIPLDETRDSFFRLNTYVSAPSLAFRLNEIYLFRLCRKLFSHSFLPEVEQFPLICLWFVFIVGKWKNGFFLLERRKKWQTQTFSFWLACFRRNDRKLFQISDDRSKKEKENFRGMIKYVIFHHLKRLFVTITNCVTSKHYQHYSTITIKKNHR